MNTIPSDSANCSSNPNPTSEKLIHEIKTTLYSQLGTGMVPKPLAFSLVFEPLSMQEDRIISKVQGSETLL
jgi:hypothetical protein